MNTINLFPVPITTFESPDIGASTLDFVKQLEYRPYHSIENYELDITVSTDVLDDYPELATLRQNTLAIANQYWKEVIGAVDSLEIQIYHSWICRHSTGQYNPLHSHNNCLFVLATYLDVPDDSGDIVFKKPTHYLNLFPNIIHIDYQSSNVINCTEYAITPKTNMTICFPSHQEHYAKPNNNKEPRYCLTVDYNIASMSGMSKPTSHRY